MSIKRSLILTGALAVLGACTSPVKSFDEIEALNQAQAVGSPFTVALTDEYRHFVNSEYQLMYDYPDALHFARKGLAASAGKVVLPEPTEDWNLRVPQIQALTAARGDLINVFNLGARELAPFESAKAQVMFDCWIEQEEETWQVTEIRTCQQGFIQAMGVLQNIVAVSPPPPAPVPAPVAAPTPVQPLTGAPIDPFQPMAAENAMFLVFFDWDSSKLDASGQKVLNAVAEEIARNNPVNVQIVGHADTSGPSGYNQTLANQRAKTVRSYLTKSGVDAGKITISSRGENELLVDTADNVREPANRRANIRFR